MSLGYVSRITISTDHPSADDLTHRPPEQLQRPVVDLDRSGTPEKQWTSALEHCPQLPADRWRRVVVLAPHPDDETLGVGGTIARCARSGTAVTVIAVTDGESAPNAAGDAAVRRSEQERALHYLAPAGVMHRLGLRDGEVADAVDELAERLQQLLAPGDIVLAPFDRDGHPDHDATGRAARLAVTSAGAMLWMYPIWAWHWHDPATSRLVRDGVRVELMPVHTTVKQTAMNCYRSQLEGADPVVPGDMLARFRRPFELLVRP